MYVCPLCKSRSQKQYWCPKHPNEPLELADSIPEDIRDLIRNETAVVFEGIAPDFLAGSDPNAADAVEPVIWTMEQERGYTTLDYLKPNDKRRDLVLSIMKEEISRYF